jgi:alpha-D-ribose 1-methylphosphonate 5-triphosphate synthase subunit PhnL
MTNEKLVRYLSVCADLADKSDGIANVRVDHLRQAIALLSDEPKADADEIERLRKERYRLRSALGAIIGLFHDSDHEAKNIARRVLDSTAENRGEGQ